MRKQTGALALLVVTAVLLIGCWDRREINDVAFVSADAIDLENGKYRLSVQIPLPGQLGGIGQSGGGGGTGGNKPWYNDSQTGEAGGDIIDHQQLKLSRQLNFSHRRVILFGEELSRAGLSHFVDVLARVPQNRLTAEVLVTEGPGRELLNADADVERFPSEMIRELAAGVMKHPRTLKNFVDLLLTDGIDPSLPLIKLDTSKPGQGGQQRKIVALSGVAVFRDDKLAGSLHDEDAVGALIAMNDARHPAIVLPAKNESGVLSMLVQKYQTKLFPSVQDGQYKMAIDIRVRGSIQENESNYDIVPTENLDQVQQIASAKIKKMVESTVKKLQQDYQSDPFGFGDAFHRKNPKLWHRISSDWRRLYPDVEVSVRCDVHIEQTGSLLKPFGVKEVQR